MIAGALIGLRLPLPDRADLNLDPLNRFVEPSLALDLKPRSGPIHIEVEYRIHEEDLATFLEAIAERQRIRLRDGARGWTLERDLEDPDDSGSRATRRPTWVDYVRHNQRRTQADLGAFDRIAALHAGPDRPRVRRRIVRQARWTGTEPMPETADRPSLMGRVAVRRRYISPPSPASPRTGPSVPQSPTVVGFVPKERSPSRPWARGRRGRSRPG